jgi:hypothetical protein
MNNNSQFEQAFSIFQGHLLPEPESLLVGYAALIHVYALAVPLPDLLCIIGKKHKRYQQGNWLIFTFNHKPEDTLFN